MVMRAKKILLFGLLLISIFAFKNGNNARSVKKNPFHRTLSTNDDVYIIIVKSDYELKLYDKEGWYGTYPVVFGSKSLGDKMIAGDRKTPEGTFHIISKRRHEKWDKMMDIDYPTKADYAKFNERKAKGLIPQNAKIGNGIAIHGTWQHDEHVVDLFQNWTNGCVSLKNEDVDELYDLVPVGTKVIIQK
jgi:murein L,D-transpeptidase YafK